MSLFPKSAITDENLVNTSAVLNANPTGTEYGLFVRTLNTDPDNFNTNANLQVANADVSNANPVPISGVDLDIRDLNPTQDKIAIGDGTDTLGVNADGSINVNATISNQLESPAISHYFAQASGTGYTAGNAIQRLDFYNDTQALTSTIWRNLITGSVISPAPSLGNLVTIEQLGEFLPSLVNFDIALGDFRSDMQDLIGLTNEAPYTSATGSVFAGLNSLLKGLNLRPTVGTQINFTSTTSAVIDGLNNNRKGMTITNEGAGDLYILLGSGTASITNYTTKILPNGYYELPFKYAGVITGIFASAGTARITLLT